MQGAAQPFRLPNDTTADLEKAGFKQPTPAGSPALPTG